MFHIQNRDYLGIFNDKVVLNRDHNIALKI